MPRQVRGSSDAHALRMIQAGRIVADPATGVVLVDGRPVGTTNKRTGYNHVYCAGRSMLAHRIVWLFANGPIPDGHVINHRDGNRRNNRLANLEAVTQRQNVLHAIRDNRYRGTYPGEAVDADTAARAAALAVRGDVTRQDVLALLGVEPEAEDETIEALMRAPSTTSRRKLA